MHKLTWFFLFFIAFSFSAIGQECFEYHKSACIPEKSDFVYEESNNTISLLFTAGEKRQVPLTIYAGKDYRITICGEDVFSGVILFKILNEHGEVIYDNSQNKYLLNIEFATKKTQSAQIEIEVPDVATTDTLKPKGCIGILVEDMVSIKTGF